MAGFESRPFQPTPHESDFRFDDALPRVAICLDLQRANKRVRLPVARISLLHNTPFAEEPAVKSVPPVSGCT